MNIDFKNYLVLVDTCTLMTETAKPYFDSIKEDVINCKGRIIIQYMVAQEINKLMKKEDKEVRRKAKNAALLVHEMRAYGVFEIFGSERDDFADHQFQTVIQRFRSKNNICIITQDSKLAHDLLNQKNTKSVHYQNNDIKILRLDESVKLIAWSEIKKRQEEKALRMGLDLKNSKIQSFKYDNKLKVQNSNEKNDSKKVYKYSTKNIKYIQVVCKECKKVFNERKDFIDSIMQQGKAYVCRECRSKWSKS